MIPARPFFMIRHGETVMNALKLSCGGGVDTTLNDDGRAQAQVAARVLQLVPEKPTLIIQSGMSRTRETARIINAHLGLPVLEDNELREHMLGVWENKPWEETSPLIRAGIKPEGGESADEFAVRVRSAMRRNMEAHPEARILFVVHGGTFHAFQRMHGQYRRVFIPNATLHRFDPEPAYQPVPWRVQMLDLTADVVTMSPSPICSSQQDPK